MMNHNDSSSTPLLLRRRGGVSLPTGEQSSVAAAGGWYPERKDLTGDTPGNGWTHKGVYHLTNVGWWSVSDKSRQCGVTACYTVAALELLMIGKLGRSNVCRQITCHCCMIIVNTWMKCLLRSSTRHCSCSETRHDLVQEQSIVLV